MDLEALIPTLSPDDADKIGVSRRALYYHQEMIRLGKPLNLKDSIRMKYTRHFNKAL